MTNVNVMWNFYCRYYSIAIYQSFFVISVTGRSHVWRKQSDCIEIQSCGNTEENEQKLSKKPRMLRRPVYSARDESYFQKRRSDALRKITKPT